MKTRNSSYIVAAAVLMLVAAGGRIWAEEKPCPVPHKKFQLPGIRPGLMLLDRANNRLYVEAGTSLLDLDLKTWKANTIPDVLLAAPYATGANGRHPEACRLYQREVSQGPMIVLRAAARPDILVGGYKKGVVEPVWTYLPPVIPPISQGINASGYTTDRTPVDGFSVVGKTVYGVSTRGMFFALNMADGQELWTLKLGNNHRPGVYSRFVQPPLVSDDVAYVASGAGLSAIDLKKKEVKWHKRTKGVLCSAPAISGNIVFFSTNHHGNRMYALDRATGKELWQFGRKSSMKVMLPPVVGKDAVFVVTDAMGSPTCYALDKKTKKILWKRPLGGRIHKAPVLVDGRLWLSIDKKKIIGIPETGQGPIQTCSLPALKGCSEQHQYLAGMPGWLFVTTTARPQPGNPPFAAKDTTWLHVIKLPAHSGKPRKEAQ